MDIDDGKWRYVKENISLLDLCIENTEMEKFNTSTLQQLI